jgi:hypothetical protein
VRSNPNLNSLVITRLPTNPIGKKFFVKVEVFNEVGSTISEVCSVTLAILPFKPPNLSFITSGTNEKQVTLDLSAFTETYNGGSQILSYEIQSQLNGGEFSSLIGHITPYYLSTFVTTNISRGNYYGFRYRAKNLYGWGPFSNTISHLAARTPLAPATPQLVSVSSTSVSLRFSPSPDNGGALISDYELWMDQGISGSTFAKLPYVFATNQFSYIVDVVVNHLTPGSYYRFMYRGINSKGNGDYSNQLAVPIGDIPSKPTSLTRLQSTKTSIMIGWPQATGTQGSVGNIKGYQIYMDNCQCGNFELMQDGSN